MKHKILALALTAAMLLLVGVGTGNAQVEGQGVPLKLIVPMSANLQGTEQFQTALGEVQVEVFTDTDDATVQWGVVRWAKSGKLIAVGSHIGEDDSEPEQAYIDVTGRGLADLHLDAAIVTRVGKRLGLPGYIETLVMIAGKH